MPAVVVALALLPQTALTDFIVRPGYPNDVHSGEGAGGGGGLVTVCTPYLGVRPWATRLLGTWTLPPIWRDGGRFSITPFFLSASGGSRRL